jgi:hypothetical protein
MKLKKWNISLLLIALMAVQGAYTQDSAKHSLLPDHLKLQFAGGIGFLSIGAGYSNKKQWLETDVYYGYVPKSIGGVTIHSLTGKLSVFPIKFNFKNYQLKPFSIGLLVNYTLGKQYFGFTPENYPFNYYGFPTSLHAGAFVGGQVNKKLKEKKPKQIGLYYEVISFDSEIISYLGNKNSLKFSDIINIGFGIKAAF